MFSDSILAFLNAVCVDKQNFFNFLLFVMEIFNEEYFRLEDQINKCRCCLRILIDEQKGIIITKTIEKNFFDLTQIKVSFNVFSCLS